MKIVQVKLGHLKRMIAEGIISKEFLFEADVNQEEEGQDSLDAQVDRYLASYEHSSKQAKNEGKSFSALVRRLLIEADDEEKDDSKEGDDGSDPPQKMTLKDIDVEEFADNVTRLIENYDSLLEVRSTLLRRAIKFIEENYEQDVVDVFKDAMREQHAMVPGMTKMEVEDEDFAVPRGEYSGPSLGGGGGGAA